MHAYTTHAVIVACFSNSEGFAYIAPKSGSQFVILPLLIYRRLLKGFGMGKLDRSSIWGVGTA